MADEKERYLNSVNVKNHSDFPYLVLDVRDDTPSVRNPGFRVMHWHDDLQMIYLEDGAIEVITLHEAIRLQPGEAVFLNAGVVHRVRRCGSCHYYSFIFPQKFLSFYPGSPAEDFVRAQVKNENFTIRHLKPDTDWENGILTILKRLADLEHRKVEKIYPYAVLVNLCAAFLKLAEHLPEPKEQAKTSAAVRVRAVLHFIEQHYSEDLSLEDLAKSAAVSKTECTRCFRQCLGTTPYGYLIEYRLSAAAGLLRTTDYPVSVIAQMTGFQQPSHFGKCFKERTGQSPRDYRRAQRK